MHWTQRKAKANSAHLHGSIEHQTVQQGQSDLVTDSSKTDVSLPRSGRRRYGLWVVVFLLVVVGGIGGLALRQRPKPMEVRATRAEKQEIVSRVLAQGKIRARRQVEVASEISGRVTQVFVGIGDRVDVGQLLFSLDDKQLKNATSQLRVALRAADAMLERAQLMQQESERNLARNQALLAREVGTQAQVTADEARVQLALADVKQALAGQERARLELLRAEDALRKAKVVAPIAGVVVDVSLEVGEVVAPLGGMSGGASMGGLSLSGAGGPGNLGHIVVADLSELMARLDVDELDVGRVKKGQRARLTALSADLTPFQARISQVAMLGRDVGGAVQFAVEAQVEGYWSASASTEPVAALAAPVAKASDASTRLPAAALPQMGATEFLLRPGMTVSAEIEVERLPEAVAIPIAAVLEGDSRPGGVSDKVWLIEEKEGKTTVRAQALELGPTDQDAVAVLSGIQSGDTVVEGPFRALRELEEGALIKIERYVALGDVESDDQQGKLIAPGLLKDKKAESNEANSP